jgi:lipopolysaccharide export LptBFGC system permease protein LptF
MPQTKDLLAQARTQIAEEIKMLKEQKTNGDIADDAYALRVNTLYESAKQLYELKQRMEEEKQKTTHETSVQYINHKYDISRYTEVKKTQRKLFDLVQDNRKMREKDVKELNKMTNEFRSVGNLNQIQVTELKKKMTELVSRYK